ncbi:cell wall elongation regulator TseB-like domain-containing protein [Cytobacillus kochii]|uniref:cell wall elongation regulator TseB-like domain-containing protein n=1 Tax=Cytobacillus kochii TaxID=859143 RepID=UPI0025A16F1C|nr:DUF5590 domain-containing protein [Cytobacillus kochii]MDM5208203.1 DUF5590 domain-containing protein [Cytobacillus kochii]
MKKILIIVLAIMVFIIGFSAKVYIKAMEPINQAEKVAKEKAENEANLQTVKRVTLYNGNETYYIIDGITKEDEEVYVWVSADSEDEVIIKNKKDGISKEEAIEKVMNKKNPTDIISVNLGMEKSIPLWEISYKTGEGLLNYYVIDYETGNEELKILENL